MSKTIELNVDLSDWNYIFLGIKAFDQWEFVKQQSEMCNNCNREDFTSDLIEPEKKYNPDDPYWNWLKKHNESMIKPVKGFYFNDVFVEIEEDQEIEEVLEEFRLAIFDEKIEEKEARFTKFDRENYWEEVNYWKVKGMKYEDQPIHPDGTLWFSIEECIEYQKECKNKDQCNMENCNPKSCHEYQSRF